MEIKKEDVKNTGIIILKKVLLYLILAAPFVMMDICIRVTANAVDYNKKSVIRTSILFEVSIIIGIVLLVKVIGGMAGRVVYGLIAFFFTVMFLANQVYYSLTTYFFSFRLVFMAGEGSSYILDTVKNTPIYVWLELIILIFLIIFALLKIDVNDVKSLAFRITESIIVIVLLVIAQFIIPVSLGKGNKELKWDSFRKTRNVYEEFSDVNKNMKICGFLKYTIRDFSRTFFKKSEKITGEEEKFLKEEFEKKSIHNTNEYTGIFKEKNIIFLQLEGIDTWLLTKEDMPNLYSLKEEAMDFTNHYSYYNGGGSTFNSEFAVNTGFITPISYNKNAYTFSTNTWKENLPQIFADMGYSTNCYHMNSREFYSRGVNYEAWGYDNYYGLMDVCSYEKDDFSYEMDTVLFLNETYYNLFFDKSNDEENDTNKAGSDNGKTNYDSKSDVNAGTSKKTLKYLITYTPHTPFVTNKGVGEYLAQKVYGNEIPNMDEEAVARMMATETDDMVGLLIDGLKKEGLYDDTVIVAFADHYLYTINDKSVLDKYKETGDNRINNTPFFIWSSDIDELELNQAYDKVNSQLDILPTVLNLFGVTYDENRYIGNDIFDEDYVGYAFFDDYSFVTLGKYVSGTENSLSEEASQVFEIINKQIKKNDLVLKYDYLKNWK